MEDEEISVPLTRSEITTITAALAHWREAVIRETSVNGELVQQIPFNLELHFVFEPPLTREELLQLCQRLRAACR